MATNIGEWSNFIINGLNGFIINNEEDFINAWNFRDKIKQVNCENE